MKNASQSGFTLVELMIAILIGLFLIGGMLTLTSAMKRTYTIQGGLSQVQDNERVAFTVMSGVIEKAGYFTNPLQYTAATALPAIGSSWAAGQPVYGVGNSSPTETLSVRYMTTGSDGVLNCLGASSATPVTWINTFSLDGNGNLQCTVTTNGVAGQPGTLMTGVQSMMFYYGVATSGASVNNYLDAPTVTANSLWSNVVSVQIILSFTNPLYAAPGTAATAGQSSVQPATLNLSRWVVLMGMTGVTS
jgi:type IV pilus assembly protein PilW